MQPYQTPYWQPQQNYQQPTGIYAMYQQSQPYESQDFLLNTFQGRMQYIKVFLSLPHEDKIKLFLLIEEQKLYGQMKDQLAYQTILKTIASKVAEMQTPLRPMPTENTAQKKKKQIENKIDLIVENTFQKLKLNDQIHDSGKLYHHSNYTQYYNQQSNTEHLAPKQAVQQMKMSQQDEEWVESQAIEQEVTKHQQNIQFNSMKQIIWNQRNTQAKVQSSSALGMFSFDQNMEKAMTQQIGLVDSSKIDKISIWEMQMEASSYQTNQPSLKQIFKTNSSSQATLPQKATNIHQQKSLSHTIEQYQMPFISQSSQFTAFTNFQNQPQMTASLPYNKQIYSIVQPETFSSLKQQQNRVQVPIQSNFLPQISQKPHHQHLEVQNFTYKTQYQNSNYILGQQNDISSIFNNQYIVNQPSVVIQPAMSNKQVSYPQNQLFDFNFLQQKTQNKQSQSISNDQSLQSSIKPQDSVQSAISYDFAIKDIFFVNSSVTKPQQSQKIYEAQKQQNHFEIASQQMSTSKNTIPNQFLQQKFNNLQQSRHSSGAIQEKIQQKNSGPIFLANSQTSSLNHANSSIIPPHKDIQQLQFASLSFSQTFPQKNAFQQPSMFNLQSNQDQSSQHNNSSLFLDQNRLKYAMISHLKHFLEQQDKKYLLRHLKKNFFACDIKFFTIIIQHLSKLSLQHTEHYSYLSQMLVTIKQIKNLTQLYAGAVQQDDQEKLLAALKKSKQLCRQIQAKSQKTEAIVTNIINSEEYGLLYKLGKALIDLGISPDLVSKNANQETEKKVFTSLCLLYMIQKLSTLSQLNQNSDNIIEHLNSQYQSYRSLDSQNLAQIEKNIEQYPKYLLYLKGLVKVADLCLMMVSLLKNSGLKSQHNLTKTIKNCKQIKSKYGKYLQQSNQLHLQVYGQELRRNVAYNKSIYDLHNAFQQTFQKYPSCRVCFREVKKGQGALDEKGLVHYSCHNLLLKLAKSDI